MSSKNQGEGDYDSARRYDEHTREFIEKKQKAGESLAGSAKDAKKELTDAEREALQHAKEGEQDQRDADLLRKLESDRH
jgi:hypothetical protein